jgi:hypothetical protein
VQEDHGDGFFCLQQLWEVGGTFYLELRGRDVAREEQRLLAQGFYVAGLALFALAEK